jgi:outer membrane murein-binding lipoprotein Lpp
MSRPRIVLLALAAAATLLLSGCIGPFQTYGPLNKSIDLIYHAEFSQSQAVPDFDDSEYTIEEYDPALELFKDQLRGFDIEPWNYTPRETDGCTGGVTTTVRMLYHGSGESTMVIDACGAADDSFEAVATQIFTDFREAQSAELPNSDIVSLTFSQSQALPDFDTSEHTQDKPRQIAKFTDLLFEKNVVWSLGIDPSLVGEPCPGSITTAITAHYSGTDVVVGPVEIGGCSDDAWVDEVTTLFANWRQAG